MRSRSRVGRASAHAAEATATSPRFNPNLITLPEPIKSRLNAGRLDGPTGFIEAVKELAVDLDVEDVWAIVLLLLISKGRGRCSTSCRLEGGETSAAR